MPNVKQMVEFGYCVSPNNIWSQPGVRMYPAGPGIAEHPLQHRADVHVGDFGVRAFRSKWDSGQFVGLETLNAWPDAASFIAWLKDNGVPSEPGLPAFANSWD